MPPKKTTSKSGTSRDADTAREILVWCRLQRFHVGAIRVGEVELSGLSDLAVVAPAVPAIGDDPASDYRTQFGGVGLARLKRDAGRDAETTVPEDDE